MKELIQHKYFFRVNGHNASIGTINQSDRAKANTEEKIEVFNE